MLQAVRRGDIQCRGEQRWTHPAQAPMTSATNRIFDNIAAEMALDSTLSGLRCHRAVRTRYVQRVQHAAVHEEDRSSRGLTAIAWD